MSGGSHGPTRIGPVPVPVVMLATVHAWVELPILLLALLGAQARSHKP